MHDHQDDLIAEFEKRREEWRAKRDARRDAWRERREERRNRWAHLGDPAFWGMDEASLRSMGMGGMGMGARPGQSADVSELKATVEAMQRTIDTLNERVQVLERLAVDDDAKLAAEIEKLRGAPGQ